MASNITQYVNKVLNVHYDELGKSVGTAAAVGLATGYLESKGKADIKLGKYSAPLDLVGGLLLTASAHALPKKYEIPLFAASAGGDLLAIAAHRMSAKFFSSKAGAVHGDPDFAPGFGADDPLLKAAAAL